ncbi:hypothetical protein [Blastomonas sp. SL216]|uniref:hypothetical protein n=1 Tax=Blastomonas sp. SL216 TaxID=2995169 RepID=UPI00237787CA|nr:hypothetical protein OU999_07310 [Blastomonas sp. SL216]
MDTHKQEPEDGQDTLQFHASISVKRALSIALFSITTLLLSYGAIRAPNWNSVTLLLASSLLLWVSAWLEWRRGWPSQWHGPACELNATGITFWPKQSRQQFLPWDDLAAVRHDMSDQSVIFQTKEPLKYDRRYLLLLKRPPYVSSGLQSPQGEHLVNVLHRYWDEQKRTAITPA